MTADASRAFQPMRPERSVAAFREQFDRQPAGVWAAPGRVNVIGEHTDYNDGFVLPIALAAGVVAAGSPRDDGRLVVRSLQSEAPVDVALDGLQPGAVEGWGAYAAGVAWALRTAGYDVAGADLIVDGTAPQGAGLSSSAALEVSVAAALAGLTDLEVAPVELAKAAKRAENDFVGMPCGIMDQLAAATAEDGHALFLDARTLSTEHVPFDTDAAGLTLLVIDTRATHSLVDGEYASRRHECEQAARELGVAALRDIDLDDLGPALERLSDDVLRRRTRHVVTENARVLDAVRVLRQSSPGELGSLLTASHASLRDDFEVSCAELDVAVDAALGAGGLGARMTGGGFGGSAIALVAADDAEAVAAAVDEAFTRSHFQVPVTYTARPSAGARRLELPAHSDRPARSCR